MLELSRATSRRSLPAGAIVPSPSTTPRAPPGCIRSRPSPNPAHSGRARIILCTNQLLADRLSKGVMVTPFDQLTDIIHSPTLDSWKDRNEKALAALFASRYPKRAERSVTLRAPDMKGGDAGVPYAAYIHPQNADSGAYGGMSFVIFPADDAPCLVAMV